MNPFRRRLLKAGLLLPAVLWLPRASSADPTPACGDGDATPAQTAGPFYTPGTPLKADFRADDPGGRPVTLRAKVLDTQCRPVAGAIVDLWHADTAGRYDNDGFRLRGHQRAGADGSVRFDTILPANYFGRTRHFHVRIFDDSSRRLLTTQLYFPGESGNARDGLFRPELLMEIAGADETLEARFAFVV